MGGESGGGVLGGGWVSVGCVEGVCWVGSSLVSLWCSLGLARMVHRGRWNNHGSYHKVGEDSNQWLKRRRARVSGRAGVAWTVAGFTGLLAGEVKWSERVAEIFTGAIKQSK